MKKYRIIILPDATQDIINLKNSIIKRYGDAYNANIVIERIFDTINSLANFPRRAQVRLEISKQKFRFIKSGKYTIIYCVDINNDSVKIYGIFHSHRDIFQIFKNRAQK